jgi:hypothetical protein
VVERNPDVIVEKQGVTAVAADGASWRSSHVARIEAPPRLRKRRSSRRSHTVLGLDNSLVWRLVFVTGVEQEPCRLGEVEDN